MNTNRKGTIYALQNKKDNNRMYIGLTIRPIEERVNEHFKSKNNTDISRAIRKYGKKSFNIIILQENINELELSSLEKQYILKYNAFENGYNMTRGGELGNSYKNYEEDQSYYTYEQCYEGYRKLLSEYDGYELIDLYSKLELVSYGDDYPTFHLRIQSGIWWEQNNYTVISKY